MNFQKSCWCLVSSNQETGQNVNPEYPFILSLGKSLPLKRFLAGTTSHTERGMYSRKSVPGKLNQRTALSSTNCTMSAGNSQIYFWKVTISGKILLLASYYSWEDNYSWKDTIPGRITIPGKLLFLTGKNSLTGQNTQSAGYQQT